MYTLTLKIYFGTINLHRHIKEIILKTLKQTKNKEIL